MDDSKTQNKQWVISTREELRDAVVRTAREARRKLSIFTPDLEPGIYDDPAFLDVIQQLVLSRSYSRIRVLIADPGHAIEHGNRFVRLGRRLNTQIEFRHVREDWRMHAESFCIADRRALVYRLQAAQWEGIADLDAPPVARLYSRMFDQIWTASAVDMAPPIPATRYLTLGGVHVPD